jgi:hypothetical protein
MSSQRRAFISAHNDHASAASGKGRRSSFRVIAAGLAGAMIAAMVGVLMATAAPAVAQTPPTWSLAHADIYDSSYNQSSTSVITVTDTNGGVTPLTISATPGNGFTCGAPTTLTSTTASCTIEAATGDSDDSGVPGGSGTPNTVTVSETDSSGTYTQNEAMIIYPPPVCAAAPGSTGSYSGTNDTMSSFGGGTPVAEVCDNGASGPASGLLTNVSPGGTVLLGSNATDAAGGSALTIMTGPGFNWTGSAGSGEADVDTGTAGLSGQTWDTTVTLSTVTSGSNTVSTTASSVPSSFSNVSDGDVASGTGIPVGTTVTANSGNSVTLSNNATANGSGTVTKVATSSGSPTVTATATSVPANFTIAGIPVGSTVTGTGIPASPPTTVLANNGTNLMLSANATATSATGVTLTFTPAPETVTFNAPMNSPPVTSWLTSASTVAASFKSSGDPLNTCPPPPAMIAAGMPFCLEEFETTGAGPSATQVALDYAGQSVPTTTTPTVALSSGSSTPGGSINITDAANACPSTIGTGSTNLLNGSYNCWYGRAGDPTPVTVTVGGVPATATPTAPATADVSEGLYTVDGPSDTSTYDGAGTITLMNVSNGSNTVTSSATSAGTATAPYNDLVGDGVSGTDIPIGTEVQSAVNNGNGTWSFTLTNSATATPAAETLTFYAVTLNPPQLAATFTVPATAPAGPDTVEVCEPTAAENGNDWEFGVQWMQASGSLSNIGGGPATQVCSSTTLDVSGVASSTTSTPTNSSIALGASNTDSASVTGTGGGANPTGTVSFYACGPSVSSCTPSGTPFDTETLGGSSNPGTVTSASFTPDAAGTWCFAAVYGGDGNYSGSSDTSNDECFSVGTTGSTTVSSPTNSNVSLGASNTDSATVTGSDPGVDPTGTVSFYACGPNVSSCTPSGTPFDAETLSGLSNPDTVTSASFAPDAAGTWCFAAVYSGDGNYSGSSDTSNDECFTVPQATSSTVSKPSSNTAALDGPNSDSVVVTGNDYGANPPAPSGTVTFYTCPVNVNPCTSANWTQLGSPASLTAGESNTSGTDSAPFTNDAAGTWCFAAVYNGDSSYTRSSDQGSDECYTVGQATTSTLSAPLNATIDAGQSNIDQATVTGNDDGSPPAPSGTVTFYQCGPTSSPTPCTGGTQVGTPVNLTTSGANTATANSATFQPNSAPGYWCFRAVYNGDGNYFSSSDNSSVDECFFVNGPLTITTTSLPNGREGTPYTAQLNAEGGTTPYKWSKSGALPRGLVLNHTTGAISGTPTRVGSYTFTIKVKDHSHPKQTASKSFSVTIAS